MPIVGYTKTGRPIYGHPGTKYVNFLQKFQYILTDKDFEIWLGGEVTMPYWANPSNSRYLTDEEIEKYLLRYMSKNAIARYLIHYQ